MYVEQEGRLSDAFLGICTKMDTNGDGFVSYKDFDSYMAKPLRTRHTDYYNYFVEASPELANDYYDYIRKQLVDYFYIYG